MKLLEKQYYNLEPKFDYLKDSFILGLAWKKTDSFVRTHNWYADLLALDKCAFDISAEVTNWSKEAENEALTKSDIELIPAPKGANWFFRKRKWTTNKDDRKLRPLANISIKDQSFATAVMMCLADAIETRQKDCSLSNLGYDEHVKNKVVSYGNRLVCDWDNEEARFRWGGSEYYRKFSTDYRSFLQRPIYIGRETVNKISGIDDVYIVSLDLKNFFGSVKINLLLEQLKKISSNHYGSNVLEHNNFWDLSSQILNWKWPESSLSLLESLDLKNIVGLPQGLASAGALANAYLIEFDESIISKLRTKIENSHIILHDYCRYVDDIRLVISGEALENKEIKQCIHRFVQGILDETLDQNDSDKDQYLEVNDSKTSILILSDIDNESGLTNRINEIQHEIGASSIPERNGLDNNIPALQQLLLTEQDNFFDGANGLFTGFNNDKSIKVESLRRFSAHRLETSLAKKNKLISPEERKQFDNESELIAKKLLTAWLKDPSIMVLFRKAITINPNLDAYSTILDIIFSKIKSNREKREKYIMLYLLSDIFRSVVDIYRNQHTENASNYQKLMGEITSFAQKLLSCKSDIPSYAYQQALLYLAVINKPFIASNKASPDLARLQSVLIKRHLEPLDSSDGYLFELSAQISKDYQANAAFLLSHTNNKEVVDSIIEKFAFRGGEFWNTIWKEIVRVKKHDNVKNRIDEFRWAIPKSESRPNGSEHYLSSLISFKENPFKYEHALLKLGVALVNLFDDKEKNTWQPNGSQYFSPHEIKVKLDNISTSWTELWHPGVKISCTIDKIGKDPRYKSPEWLVNSQQPQNDEHKLYWVCSVLRSAALGNVDYTQRNDLKPDRAKYDGIRSQFYKRRMGMLHTPESIVGSYGTITDWFANFLQHGLQWPGFSSSHINQEDILSITSLGEFKKCMSERLGYLEAQICISSNVPTFPTVVSRPELASNHFRIVTVQQLFPKDKHFHPSDVTLDNSDVRWKHREHLAEICKLTEQTLNAKLNTESRDHASTADLIVFSELAVHPEDEDIVRALAFRTKAIIFCGFVFCEQDGRIVNKARWIIPDTSESGTQWRIRDQGKYHMTSSELSLGVQGYRPSQHIISIEGHPEGPFKLTGAICYDATDIRLAADLRDLTDLFVIAAYNKDVDTFDNMASALQWHMYQHVVITNTGEYGGSTMQAPYKEKHHKLISHAHGTGQIAISTADIDLAAFRRKIKEYKKTKTQPAGFNRKH
ncbi:RNA-directed DNA polymerase [Pantoea stewartii]|uniref:RNA-directed DNA polymerase n=1 Tax=Pantoea stewartii TaxID=66269 RepID=UPI00197E9C80|nr:RNA-directed DNA polymerase [Pantoea stewartii]